MFFVKLFEFLYLSMNNILERREFADFFLPGTFIFFFFKLSNALGLDF